MQFSLLDKVAQLIAEVADEEILPRYKKLAPEDIELKNCRSHVTTADKEAEKALSHRLSDLLPGSKTVGEEAFAANNSIFDAFSGESPVWLIDPVDGTSGFIKHSDLFGVIVSLIKQNQVVAGWLYHPTSREFVMAEKGAGVTHQGKRVHVLPPAPLTEMRGSCYYRPALKAFQNPSTTNKPLDMKSSRGLACCVDLPRTLTAGPVFGLNEPQLHFALTDPNCYPWDVATGLFLHAEAGGFNGPADGKAYSLSGGE